MINSPGCGDAFALPHAFAVTTPDRSTSDVENDWIKSHKYSGLLGWQRYWSTNMNVL